jgi:AraC-like DNA-binding protein
VDEAMTTQQTRMRVVRHESESDRWELVHCQPDSRLRGYISSYCLYDEQTASFQRRRELPSDRVTLIVNLGEPIRVGVHADDDRWSDQPAGFLAGLWDTYALTETRGSQRGVQVDLSAVGAHLLLGVPMHELTNRVVTLDELFGAGGTRLREAVATAPGRESRFALLDDFFLERLDDARSPVPSVTRALARLHQTGGNVRVRALADEIGCSSRHLIARFNEQVGVSPKLLARILRFERAVKHVDAGSGWAEIAQDCGYYDQAHLTRDFNQFAGCPPGEFARRRLPDGGGVAGD